MNINQVPEGPLLIATSVYALNKIGGYLASKPNTHRIDTFREKFFEYQKRLQEKMTPDNWWFFKAVLIDNAPFTAFAFTYIYMGNTPPSTSQEVLESLVGLVAFPGTVYSARLILSKVLPCLEPYIGVDVGKRSREQDSYVPIQDGNYQEGSNPSYPTLNRR